MGRRRGKRRRPQGFNEGPLRPFTNAFFGGKDKRRSLNHIAFSVAVGFGFLGGAIGLKMFGFLGAVIGFVLGCAAGGSFVTKRRYYR